MRNLVQYPITNEEIIDCLQQLSAELVKEQLVGDMRPLLLLQAVAIVKQATEEDTK